MRRAWRVVDRLRRPEYTGPNRCWPCTVTNLVLAGGGAVILAFGLVRTGSSVGVAAAVGVVTLAIAAATISLRGYLVPGTPTLTKRYVPDWLLRRFDAHPAGRSDAGEAPHDRETLLKRAGVVEDCDRGDDLCLTDEFRTAWRDRIHDVRRHGVDATRDDLATLLGADAAALTIDEFSEAFVARLDGERVGQWESEAAYLADVAAAAELRERVADWDRIDVEERGELLSRLRVFLDACPACDGPVGMHETVIESCCRSIDVVAVSCRACDSRLFETEHPGAG